jgi:hypothetical protein
MFEVKQVPFSRRENFGFESTSPDWCQRFSATAFEETLSCCICCGRQQRVEMATHPKFQIEKMAVKFF